MFQKLDLGTVWEMFRTEVEGFKAGGSLPQTDLI